MNTSLGHPRVYKKKEKLELKTLANPSGQEYLFWSKEGGIKVCVKLLNNLNEIVARCYHKTNKIGSYFGVGKKPSEKLTKHPNNFHNHLNSLKSGNNSFNNEIRKSIHNLEDQNTELIKIIKSLQENEKDLKESLSEILALVNNINDKT